MKNKIIERFLIWLIYWGGIIDGIIGVLTLGFIDFTIEFKFVKVLTRWQWKNTL